MLRTPDGTLAGNIDRIMLLAIWARHLRGKGHKIIAAGMGRPTLAMNENAASASVRLWSEMQYTAQSAHHTLRNNGNNPQTRNMIVKMGGVSDYGDPQGDFESREIIAEALTQWYQSTVKIQPKDILFTVGGAGAIHDILKVIHNRNPTGTIITPAPHYTLYSKSVENMQLHTIDVMKEPGYRLTAEVLQKGINQFKKIKNGSGKINAILFCDPNNPLGTVINEKEWKEIAAVLRNHPDIPIILDEAYAEMRLDGEHYKSLLEIAPDLQNRIILIRSATKALSAAGERMAVVVTPDSKLMQELVAINISICGHAPRSLQKVFASALKSFGKIDREELAGFYGEQVKLVNKRLADISATMPDPHYKVEGTFYTLANLDDLLGLDIPTEAEAALGKSGKIETDEDIVYYLLFKGIMVAPLSYFGVDSRLGAVRITCSGGDDELNQLCDNLSKIVTEARKIKRSDLEKRIFSVKQTLQLIDKNSANVLEKNYPQLLFKLNLNNVKNSGSISPRNASELKILIDAQQKCLEEAEYRLDEANRNLLRMKYGKNSEKSAIGIQSFFRGALAQQTLVSLFQAAEEEWKKWVVDNNKLEKVRKFLLDFSPSERMEYKPWLQYLNQKSKQPQISENNNNSHIEKLN